jgi:hypothetical protein
VAELVAIVPSVPVSTLHPVQDYSVASAVGVVAISLSVPVSTLQLVQDYSVAGVAVVAVSVLWQFQLLSPVGDMPFHEVLIST